MLEQLKEVIFQTVANWRSGKGSMANAWSADQNSGLAGLSSSMLDRLSLEAQTRMTISDLHASLARLRRQKKTTPQQQKQSGKNRLH